MLKYELPACSEVTKRKESEEKAHPFQSTGTILQKKKKLVKKKDGGKVAKTKEVATNT